jgi:hypothetical protein
MTSAKSPKNQRGGAIQVKSTSNLKKRQEEREERLDRRWQPDQDEPILNVGNIRYELSDRIRATDAGGLGLVTQVVERLKLAEQIDGKLQLLKRHKPYHESDHVLSLAYTIMSGESALDGMKARREDLAFLDILGARRTPHPTTAGDFLRRFKEEDVHSLLSIQNACSAMVWQSKSEDDRALALIDVDGTIGETTGNCKEQMALAYDGTWGYHPLVVSLANSQEVLSVVNRPGNFSSNSGADEWMEKAARWAMDEAGFAAVRLRGDTAFSLTYKFDQWADQGFEFVFGIMAHNTFVDRAESIPEKKWRPFVREQQRAGERRPQENVRQRVVEENGYKELHLEAEHITEWRYRPKQAKHSYRMVVLRKTIKVTEGQLRLQDEVRYFFYVTNIDRDQMSAEEVVRQSNDRCNQENLIGQLKSGVGATRFPSVSFLGNWAHMAISALAWNLKTWLALLLEGYDRTQARQLLRIGFRSFVNRFVRMPVQILSQSRRRVFRLLADNCWTQLMLEAPAYLRKLCLA